MTVKKEGQFRDGFLSRLEKVFGKPLVSDVMKFEQNYGGGDNSILARQNKEVFNGTSYLNTAPGERTVVTEDKNDLKKWVHEVTIKKMDLEKQIVIGEVYTPYNPNDPTTVDTQDMMCTAEEIEKAAYEFMEKYRQIDKQHNYKTGYAVVVESYIAKKGDPMFREGSWILGVRVTDPNVWELIKSGKITGFSLAGSARLKEVVAA